MRNAAPNAWRVCVKNAHMYTCLFAHTQQNKRAPSGALCAPNMSVSISTDGFRHLSLGAPRGGLVRFGAPQRDLRRYAILKRAGQRPQTLFEVMPNDTHVPLTATHQPFLDDHVVAQLPDDAVTVLDLTTEADWSASQNLDSLHTAAVIVHSLPLGAHDDPMGVYGNWMLQQEDWDYLALGGGGLRIHTQQQSDATSGPKHYPKHYPKH
jgi:hypothetical protein